jgi:AraC-like DNA-binding protein
MTDEVLVAIDAGLRQHIGGDRAGAYATFTALWASIGPDGDPLHRVALAHHMADVCDDPAEELEWDLRALAAAGAMTDSATARGFYPSLHLNLGEDYRKLGDVAAAREQLSLARARLDALCDDDYATGIRLALDGLAERLG